MVHVVIMQYRPGTAREEILCDGSAEERRAQELENTARANGAQTYRLSLDGPGAKKWQQMDADAQRVAARFYIAGLQAAVTPLFAENTAASAATSDDGPGGWPRLD